MNEAIYVQIAPDTASEDSNDNSNTDDIKTKRQLCAMCIIIICAVLFISGLGLYFLITKH
jgi:hypothetical protein